MIGANLRDLRARVTAPDSLKGLAADKWRDSVRRANRVLREALRDSLDQGTCDATGTRTLARARYDSLIVAPCTPPLELGPTPPPAAPRPPPLSALLQPAVPHLSFPCFWSAVHSSYGRSHALLSCVWFRLFILPADQASGTSRSVHGVRTQLANRPISLGWVNFTCDISTRNP